MQNLRLALRALRKTPFVTIVAVLSLALGIGANTAIFSTFDQMLLAKLVVPHPDQLVNLGAPGPKPGSTSCGQAGECDVVFSYRMFRDLEAAGTASVTLAAHQLFGVNVAYGTQTMNGQALLVSGSYFPALAVRPALGRLLAPSDDQTIGAHPLAVLSYAYWQNRLGSDSGVLNKLLLVNGQSMTIVGVAPPDFDGTTLGARAVAFVPISMRGVLQPTFHGFENRRSYWVYVFGRLAPGTSMEKASVAVNAAYTHIIGDVEAPLQKDMSEQTLAKFRAKHVTFADGSQGQSNIRDHALTPLLLLFATTGIVLLIACANVANLLLARAADRSGELAVRLALGASRAQLIRQLLVESLVLASLGAVASLGVAWATLQVIMGFMPGQVATAMHFELHLSALWFAALLALGTGMLFGLFPALHSTRPNLDAVLRSGSGKLSGARAASRFRTGLVTAQIALAMALLSLGGLFIRSLNNVSRADLGLSLEHVVTFGISPELNGYAPSRSRQLVDRVTGELAALPGVTDVSASLVPLLSGSNWGNDVSVQGFKRDRDTDANAAYNEVGPAYFRAVGIQLLSGRPFAAGDVAGAPPVVIVNEAFAKKFGLGRDAVGKFMAFGRSDSLNIQIVGLVKDAKYSEVKRPVPPVVFRPIGQDTTLGSATFYVRSSGDPRQVLRAINPVIARLDATLPVEDLKTMPEQVRENVFMDRMIGTLSVGFALLATLLAAVGLYGVLAYSVSQRTREIGVRMALGAESGGVLLMVMRQVGKMTVVGSLIGLAGALGLGRGARSILYGLEGTDPLVLASAAIVLAAVAAMAGLVPALRASRVEPMQALRYE